MRIIVKSLDSISFSTEEQQMDWSDSLWSPVGQDRHYALEGNLYVNENPRSGRPITLVAELPWCWLKAATVTSLKALCDVLGQTHTITLEVPEGTSVVYSVIFRRDQNPLSLTPLDPRRDYFTGTLYLLKV